MDDPLKKQDPQIQAINVGTSNKEGGARAYIERAEPELKLPQEVKEAGVREEEPQVPEDRSVGIVPTGESAKPNIVSPKATFAMSQKEAGQIVRESKTEFNIMEQKEGIYGGVPSILGLAVVALKNFKKRLTGGLTQKYA